MVFSQDGSVRTTEGWTFHKPTPLEQRPTSDAHLTAKAPTEIFSAILTTARRHQRNAALRHLGMGSKDWLALFQALIEAESAYRPDAVSPKGAYGLGQLMAETAQDLGVDRTDIAQNLDGAARYLLAQLAAFEDVDLALAAYNAGPHRIVEYGGVPPFKETRNYILRVHRIRVRLLNTPLTKPTRTTDPGALPRSVVLELK